jgi:cell wall-associated NlpC family hydrolase
MTADERAARFPLESDAIARSAETRYAGASYVWGGVTPWGCDCSGFVQRIFLLHGVQLPRDAWQQAMAGSDTHRHMDDEHAPGDLLFFSDREDQRVTHVGVALDGRRMVHSALMRGGIAIESLKSADPYVARLRSQCVAVKRML